MPRKTHPKTQLATKSGIKLGLLISAALIAVGIIYAAYSFYQEFTLEQDARILSGNKASYVLPVIPAEQK